MKKIIGGIIAILVIVMLVIAIGLAGGTSYWETEVEFGKWQEGITIGFSDGTEESLKIIQDNKGSWIPLSVEYGDQEIDWIEYYVLVSLSDTGGYDSVKVDSTSTGLVTTIYKSDGTKVWAYTTTGSKILTVTPPGSGTKLINYRLESSTIESETTSDGTYTVQFSFNGYTQYWGYPGGESNKKYATLPSTRTVYVDVSGGGSGGEISILLYGNIGSMG